MNNMTDDEINQLVESYGLAGEAGTLAFHIACDVRRKLTASTESPDDHQKRKTVKLWAPARMLREGKDWPMRVSLGDWKVGDHATWVEIKHDGYRFYVED